MPTTPIAEQPRPEARAGRSGVPPRARVREASRLGAPAGRLTERRPLRDGGGRDGCERDEPGLAGRLQRARRGAEGGARALRRHGAEAVAAEVAVVAGRSALSVHRGVLSGVRGRPDAADGGRLYGRSTDAEKACPERKTCMFPATSKRPKTAAFYALGPSVARARNACGKFSTGMMRSPSACFRASRALSPAGTRKASTCACARADRFLLDPADRADRAVGEDLAGRGDLVAVDDVAAELLHHLEREREAGRRAADVAGVDPHVERQVDVERRLEEDADDRRGAAPCPRRRS